MILRPVHKNHLRNQTFAKYFYVMVMLGDEEYPMRVLVQRYFEKDNKVQVQPTTCNTGKSVWIDVDRLLEEVSGSSHVT